MPSMSHRWSSGVSIRLRFHRAVLFPATTRRTLRTTMYASIATLTVIKPARTYAAEVNEIPMPVASAMYAATHAGHFGMTASTTLGTIQPATPTLRRANVGVAKSVAPLFAAWQQLLAPIFRLVAIARILRRRQGDPTSCRSVPGSSRRAEDHRRLRTQNRRERSHRSPPYERH